MSSPTTFNAAPDAQSADDADLTGDGADATVALYERMLDDARNRLELTWTQLRAAKADLATSQSKVAALEARLQDAGCPSVDAADPAAVHDAILAEVRRGAAKFDELKRRAREAVSSRDVVIEQLRGRVGRRDLELERLRVAAASGSGQLSPEEAKARDQYESGRLGRGKVWALLLIRSLPVMPLLSILTALLIRAAAPSGVRTGAVARNWGGLFDSFLAASLVSVSVVALGCLCAVWLLWAQLGPRWIWLRRVNTRSRRLEAITSGGESVALGAEDFCLETSPILSVLGLGVIRRTESGQAFVTSEPGAWTQGPFPPRRRWRLGADAATLACVGAWVALALFLAARA